MPRKETCQALAVAITDTIYSFGPLGETITMEQHAQDIEALATSLHTFGVELVTETIDAMHSPEPEDEVEPDGFQTVCYVWSTEHGKCYDCNNPAAFRRTYRASLSDGSDLLCAICAANAAAEGEPISRIKEVE